MANNLTLEQVVFPAAVSAIGSTPAEDVAEQSPAARAGLASGLMLALRFVQARFLSVWGLLLAAAMCPAQVFADFAVYAALANFVSIATLLRFEAVFFQSKDRFRLGRAFRLSLASGVAFLLVAGVGIATACAAGWLSPTAGTLFLVSLGGRAIIRLVSSEATAEGDFPAIGNCNVVQALVQPGMMILLIWALGATSLSVFAADAVGHIAAACYLVWRRRASLAWLARAEAWSLIEIRQSASRWRSAPSFLLPSALLSFGFMVIPLLALPHASDKLLAAHVALAMRLLDVPTQMFAAVSVPLVLSSLRARAAEGRQIWVRFVTLGLIVAATVLFVAIALVAAGADAFLDGTQWEGVGEAVAVMAIFYGGVALVTPLHEMAVLVRDPRRQVWTNALALLAAGLAMAWFGSLSLALLCVIGLVSLARMLAHVQFAWTRVGANAFVTPRS